MGGIPIEGAVQAAGTDPELVADGVGTVQGWVGADVVTPVTVDTVTVEGGGIPEFPPWVLLMECGVAVLPRVAVFAAGGFCPWLDGLTPRDWSETVVGADTDMTTGAIGTF